MLNRTLGCVRVAWNLTLAWRRQRYHAEKTGTTFAQANAYLAAMKATDELAWLNEVPSVPFQQAIPVRTLVRLVRRRCTRPRTTPRYRPGRRR
jgi:hypothetical protein